MRQATLRRFLAVVAVGAIGLTAVACSSDSESSSDTTSGEARTGELAGICPETVVMQLDWEPESEHGPLYNLVGPGYTIDTNNKRVTGPLYAQGEDTGVDVEIRMGGIAIGFTPVESLMYTDTDILLGLLRLTEAMANFETTPTVGVMAMFEKSPIAFYWDPETYPEAETVADLKGDDVTIMMGRPDVFIDWMVQEGVINESQVDLSDAPKPATFVGAGGALAELGFITAEPFLYEVEVPEWGKPVKAQLLHDIGFPEYFQSLGVREADLTEQADCLEKLMPIIQQSTVDYFADPAATNDLIVELVNEYDTGWIYTLPAAEFSVGEQIDKGIVGNGSDDAVGDYDPTRVQDLIDIIGTVTDAPVEGLSPDQLVTNQFLDQNIGF